MLNYTQPPAPLATFQAEKEWHTNLRDFFPNIDTGIEDIHGFLKELRSPSLIRKMGCVFIISSGCSKGDLPRQVGFTCRGSRKVKCTANFKFRKNKEGNKLYLYQEDTKQSLHDRFDTE